MSRNNCSLSMVLVVISLAASSALPRSANRRPEDLLDKRAQKELAELRARKGGRGLTSEEREKDGVNVLKRNGFITIHKKPDYRHTVRRNGNLVLECDVSGSPPPSVYWLKNGEPTTSQEAFDNEEFTNQISEHGLLIPNEGLASTRSRFFIDCASASDEAIYSCVAETEKDRTVSSTSVRVIGKGSDADSCESKCNFHKFDTDNDVLPSHKQIPEKSPPRIHMWSGTYVHESGKDARLICRATGSNVQIRWYNEDGEPLADGDKYQQLESGDLIVRRLEWADMGGYYCRASNRCGTAEEFTFLYPLAPER